MVCCRVSLPLKLQPLLLPPPNPACPPTCVGLLPSAPVQVMHRQQGIQVVGVAVQQGRDVVGVKRGLALLIQVLYRLQYNV